MTEWEREASIRTRADRELVWTYWTDLSHHEELERPVVERIELDGPFVTGTTGRSFTTDHRQEWELTAVREREQFGIIGHTPDRKGSLRFFWRFDDEGDGTRITYRITARGPDVEGHLDVFEGMGERMPQALALLAGRLDELAEARP